MTYTFKNGSYIEFFSADQEGKVRGPRRTDLYINECNNIRFDTYHQLAIRTSDEIYLDYNPSADFWVHDEVVSDKEDSDFVILTYKDNEALSHTIIKEIEKAKEKAKTSEYWANWWKVYGQGQTGSLEGVILSDWSQIDNLPKEARLLGYGMDFGFTNDPTVLIAVYIYNKQLIYDEVVYQTGLTTPNIIKLFQSNKVSKNMTIYCDSADPKTIAEIRGYGYKSRPTKKGQDSIRYGLNLLAQDRFLVTSSSLNTIKELRSYQWKKDKKTNKALNEPIDLFNHSIDSMRYWAMMNIKPQGISKKRSISFG